MDTDAKKSPNFIKKRWIIYRLCVVAQCVITVLQVIFYYRESVAVYLYILSSFSGGGGIYAWCHYDAKSRQFRLSENMRWAICLAGPIAVPVYFIRSRGAKTALKTGFGLLLYIPFYAVYYMIWALTVYILKAAGYYG